MRPLKEVLAALPTLVRLRGRAGDLSRTGRSGSERGGGRRRRGIREPSAKPLQQLDPDRRRRRRVDGPGAAGAPPGEHKFTVRHHDPYAFFHGNIKYESVSFRTEAGGRYRIDAAYCCGFILGQFDLFVTDEASGQQIADTRVAQ
jgi:hypothetical protein